MTTRNLFRPVLCAALLSTLAAPLFAGANPVNPNQPVFIPPSVNNAPPVNPVLPVFIPPTLPDFQGTPSVAVSKTTSAASTDAIAKSLEQITNFCSGIDGNAYRVDCLSDQLATIARQMPRTGDYAEARKALEKAAGELNQLARDNASPSLPKGVAHSAKDPKIRSSRPLVPVTATAQADVNKRAIEILDETQTILLRSAQNSEQRRAHYEQISAAVGSNKVLLRST